MKKNIGLLAALLAFSYISFAQNANPVPGISIIVKRNPGGIAFTQQTDEAGKFTTVLKKGKYDITISYSEAIKMVSSLKGNKLVDKKCYKITFTLPADIEHDKKSHSVFIIDNNTGTININVPANTNITGVLTYVDICKK